MNKEKVLKWAKTNSWFLGPWETEIINMAMAGQYDYRLKKHFYGFVDAHVHLDRAMTYENKFFPPSMNLNEIADLPLVAKQDLVGFLHEGLAYTKESLLSRMGYQIERAIKIGTRQMWAVVDTTPDIGVLAFETANELKQKYKDDIDLKVSCYPLFGFKNPRKDSGRYDILAEVAPKADFIVGLPEKDEAPDRIGFKGHVNLILELAYKHEKPIHIHVDQVNSAHQKDSFRVIECLEGLTPEKLAWFTQSGRPKLWLVHVISPSCYNGKEFSKLLGLLIKYNIGVICCPMAGVSMRQLRSEMAPIHNSLARVIEMLRHGVSVEIGTDNVNDYLVPSGNGLILRELAELSVVLRTFATHILAKVGMGVSLNNGDRSILGKALYQASKAYTGHLEKTANHKKLFFDF